MMGDLKHKTINFEVGNFKSMQNAGDDFFFVEGFASTYGNVDSVGDMIVNGAFSESLRKRKPKMLWQHKFDKPIGVCDEITETYNGLFIKGRLPKSVQASREAGELLKINAIDSLSIGFMVSEGVTNNEGVYVISKADLYEFSFVTWPANEMAIVTSIKGATKYGDLPLAENDTEWDSSSADKRVREFTKSNESPSRDYRKAFFWFDEDAVDNFTSYKLPFADVINGNLVAVPRGIFAAAGVMNGARGGVDIPDSDRSAVKSSIDKYYKKMGRESPFSNKNLTVDIKRAKLIKSKRDLEKVLRESGFSKDASIYISSKFNAKRSESEKCEDEIHIALLKELAAISKSI